MQIHSSMNLHFATLQVTSNNDSRVPFETRFVTKIEVNIIRTYNQDYNQLCAKFQIE